MSTTSPAPIGGGIDHEQRLGAARREFRRAQAALEDARRELLALAAGRSRTDPREVAPASIAAVRRGDVAEFQ
ncbi:hypothetical protein AB0N73_13065 [Microbacterium sp. NPDC089189]|uniref:hypothetical protein n=1 Tax=Microbacterium sp. NPDC089189 TaxID=3154972 RepID=UPI00342232DD